MEVTIICSRCKKEIKGLKVEKEGESFTAGFYLVEFVDSYRKPGEKVVCDDCMWKDPAYMEDYPRMKNVTSEE